MMSMEQALSQVSLVAANFGNAETFGDVLGDWINFLGGKPGEVVVVDGGSKADTHLVYWDLFNAGKIDKLQVIRNSHFENDKNLCFIQEHTAGAIAGKPYVLWFKSDTLPFRKGHENWLAEAIGFLDREDTFAVGGSFNTPSVHHEAWPGWYFSHKCSENFALMKRGSFIAAMEEFAGAYIASGFRGDSPAAPNGQERYLVEVAFEKYIEKHQKYTLVKVEDPTWTVFHTNVLGKELVTVRQDYLARKDVGRYMNAGNFNRIWTGSYYGKPDLKWRNFKWRVSDSPIGALLRFLKRGSMGRART
jgi:hypothetical protein